MFFAIALHRSRRSGIFTLLLVVALLSLPPSGHVLAGQGIPASRLVAPLAGETSSVTSSASVPHRMLFVNVSQSSLPEQSRPTATLLPSGQVLIAGVSAELYDPATDTFTSTGSLQQAGVHTATLLKNGMVLITHATTAELYDPATGTFTITGSPLQLHAGLTATLLDDGRVLFAGGQDKNNGPNTPSAEVYDPATGTFTATGNLNDARYDHTATLLPDGRVFITGGYDYDPNDENNGYVGTNELYDPATGTFTLSQSGGWRADLHTATLLNSGKVLIAGGRVHVPNVSSGSIPWASVYDPALDRFTGEARRLNQSRYNFTTTLLPNGMVLAIGGIGEENLPVLRKSVELYNPDDGRWTIIGSTLFPHDGDTATLLQDGRVLIVNNTKFSAEVGTFRAANTFTGTLTYPSGWVNTYTPTLTLQGTTGLAPLAAAAVRSGTQPWTNWLPATNDQPISATVTLDHDGLNQPIALRLRDTSNQEAAVVTATLDVDTTAPVSSMKPLLATSPESIILGWSGSDALSDVASYDLEVREGTGGAWTPVLTATTALSTTYTGTPDQTYFFRVRARDVAGNLEDWPATFDTSTLVDTGAPTGSVVANGGALVTTSPSIHLALEAGDGQSAVTQMRFSNNGTTWGAWSSFAAATSHTLTAGDGLKTVYAQFRDAPGNVSVPVSDTIELDTAAGTQRLVTINNGAIWTNTVSVTLTIGAPAGTTEVQLSNDGGFGGASWQPFDTRPEWAITAFGTYSLPRTVYVRIRNVDGSLSDPYQDEIIYDPIPPIGSLSLTLASGLADQATPEASMLAHLDAHDPDNLSGVAAMRVGVAQEFDLAAWEPYRTSKTLNVAGSAGDVRVYAEFRDGAGNVGARSCAQLNGLPCRSFGLFMPMLTR